MGTAAALLVVVISGLCTQSCYARTKLQVAFGTNGLEQLSYDGLLLEDVKREPADAFHIWHMKAERSGGIVLHDGQYGWGESNNGRHWNADTHTWTYLFTWGTIEAQYVQSGDALDVNVTTKNNEGSGVTFDGACVYPLVLHFPQLPNGFKDRSYQQLSFNTEAPGITVANFGSGEVAAVVVNSTRPVYSGFVPASGSGYAYVPIISGTALDNMPSFVPRNDRPIQPGQTDRVTISLRFAPAGVPASVIAADVYAGWKHNGEQSFIWKDRRIIGSAYLASSPQGDPQKPGGFPNNPRRYFNDGNPADFDMRTTAGLARFQTRILKQAESNVENARRMDAQGVVTWDLEGEQYPQDTSYVCAPDEIATVSPEMESVITDKASGFDGKKLDDAYFSIMRKAGLRVGVCLRPQHFTVGGNGSAVQKSLSDSEVVTELARKAKFAHDRWGVTLFYVDSTVEENGRTLPSSVLQQVAAMFRDSLFIPEESTPAYYAYSAPFRTFIFHSDIGTPAEARAIYSNAFSVNMINDVDPAKLAKYRAQLTASIRNGDILMVHADYWQANNPIVVEMYRDANKPLTKSVSSER